MYPLDSDSCSSQVTGLSGGREEGNTGCSISRLLISATHALVSPSGYDWFQSRRKQQPLPNGSLRQSESRETGRRQSCCSSSRVPRLSFRFSGTGFPFFVVTHAKCIKNRQLLLLSLFSLSSLTLSYTQYTLSQMRGE